MKNAARYAFASLASVALLAGCGDKESDAVDAGEDPAMTGALGDQIMVDPELSGQNGSAVTAGTGNVELPPEQRSPEAIAAARQEAAKKAGGTLKSAPSPSQGNTASLVENAATAAQVAASAKAAGKDCTSAVQYSMNWTTKLPAALSIYPRGAVQEAAGIDKDGCSLRVVTFVTPVESGDVMDFYYTRTTAAGYNADYKMEGESHVMGGGKGGSAYLIYARTLADGPNKGLTEVDLIASGN